MGEHMPVMLREAIGLLSVKDGGTYVDLTLGRAGHASEILRKISHGRLVAFDEDEEAVEESKRKLSAIAANFIIVHDNFRNMAAQLDVLEIGKVDGILMDLGVSSPQFDEGSRGFSYKVEAPLDMRMDVSKSLTAFQIVNTYSLAELTRVFREYGEDADSYQVAKKIVRIREKTPITTTTQLAEIIKEAKPARSLEKKGHPAKQIFQAIRIEVNDELGSLKDALGCAPERLKSGGVLAIISFQSLEDRLVKQRFHELTVIEGTRHGVEILPSQIRQPDYLSLTKKPVEPSPEELLANHRAASAKLRAIKRF